MSDQPSVPATLRVHDLTILLEEAQQALAAIRNGEVDALVVAREDEAPRVFLLEGEDTAHRALLETLAEGAMTIARDGTILYANRRFAELVDRPLAEVLGASLSAFMAPEGGEVTFSPLVPPASSELKRESALLRPDGATVSVMLSMRAIEGEPETCTVVLTDLTALKAAEQALRRANDELEVRVRSRTAELERANAALRDEIAERTRLTEELRQTAEELVVADRRKDEFLSMLAHELRNPLSPILTATEMLRFSSGADPSVERHRSVIERQARNLTRLVDDLLDVSRITRRKISLRLQPVRLAAVVESAVEAARPLIDASEHALSVHLPREPVTLRADPTRFEQVIVNLLNNAAKYTEPGGRIDLHAETIDGHVVLRVKDSGAGIAADLLPHVFDLFVQGKRSPARSQGGLGVGLTLVKNLIEMHGGTVEVKSDGSGKGTEVLVRLPLDEDERASHSSHPGQGDPSGDAACAAPEPAVTADEQALPERRVLVVEDNPDVAEGMVDILELWGYRVESVASGEEALRRVETFRPHAALVDVGLPDIDGYEVARRLRRIPTIGDRVLLIGASGYGQERDRRRGTEAGFDHYLVKPVSMDLVRQLLERHPTPED